ncbi:MAG: helix-turn-helix domain-containing protein [Oligoflexales bacterium]
MSTKKKYGLKDLAKRLGPMTVGSFLRSWRMSEGFTQREFAERLKMSAANLCDIEQGRKGISVEKAEEIARIIGYSPAVLIELALTDQVREAGLSYNISVKPTRSRAC